VQHPAIPVALETDFTCPDAFIVVINQRVPPVFLLGVQLERNPEVRPTTGNRDFPANLMMAVFIEVEDGCGVGVADWVS